MDVDPRGNNGVSTHHHHHYHHHHHHHHHHFVQPPYQVPQTQAYHPYPTPGGMVSTLSFNCFLQNKLLIVVKATYPGRVEGFSDNNAGWAFNGLTLIRNLSIFLLFPDLYAVFCIRWLIIKNNPHTFT